MIRKLEIHGYQSHHNTVLELAPFTVIVGPSSVGKSAIARALKALASNQAGSSFITHGQKTMQVSATTDKGTVVLTKGKPEDSYRIVYPDGSTPAPWTKLGLGGVPEEVTALLGIAPKEAVNFAGQFDMPYLLRTSAAEVARTLGELTNVSAVFEASREALRRKSAHSTTLRMREADLAAIAPKLEAYADLPVQAEAITAAEKSLNAAQYAYDSLYRLNALLSTLQTATARLRAAEGATEAPLPSVEAAKALLGRSQRLNALLGQLQDAKGRAAEAEVNVLQGDALIDVIREEYDTALQEAGNCPTCGQDTTGVHAHA